MLMDVASELPGSAQLSVLHDACERNAAADFFYEDASGERELAHVRLLMVDEDAVYIDRPQQGLKVIPLWPRLPVTVCFQLKRDRYEFRTIVRDTRLLIEVKQGQRVPACALLMPRAVHKEQRRLDYRVSLASFEPIISLVRSVNWQPEETEDEQGTEDRQETDDGCEKCPPTFKAQLMNISAGGISAFTKDRMADSLGTGEELMVVFKLPMVREIFRFHVRVAHKKQNDHNRSWLLGLRFLRGKNIVETRAAITEISRFVAFAQRLELQRGRHA